MNKIKINKDKIICNALYFGGVLALVYGLSYREDLSVINAMKKLGYTVIDENGEIVDVRNWLIPWKK